MWLTETFNNDINSPETCCICSLVFFPRSWGFSTRGEPSHLANWNTPWQMEAIVKVKIKTSQQWKLIAAIPEKPAVEKKVQRGKTGWFRPAPRGERKCSGTHPLAPSWSSRGGKKCSHQPSPRGGRKCLSSHQVLPISLRSTLSLTSHCDTNVPPTMFQSNFRALHPCILLTSTSDLALYVKLSPRINCDLYATARLRA